MFGTNNQNQGGGLFGNTQNMSTGGGLFGGNNSGNPQGQGQGNSIFGNQNLQPAKGFGNQQGQQGGGLFGGNTSNQANNLIVAGANGIFGANQNQQGGGLFGGNTQPQQGGGGLFGNTSNTQGGGLFGGQQQNAQTPGFGGNKPGVFGGNQPQQSGGLFGGSNQPNQGVFGQNPQQTPVQSSLFGGNQQQQGGGGLFGNPQQQQQGGGLFGNTSQGASNVFGGQNQPTTNSMFGAPQQTQTTGLFGGGNTQNPSGLFGQTNQQQPGGLFGANQNQNKVSGIFGSQQPQQQQQNTGGIFGQTTNTNTSGNLFGGGQSQPQPATNAWTAQQQAQNTWGQNTGTFGGVNSNQLGGTSWGVNTTFGQPQQTAMSHPPVTPVKSKNSKVDGKHLVKCIAALDNYNGMSKQQIRCHFLLTGGVSNQPMPGNTGMFGQVSTPTTGNLWNKPTTTQAPTSFGQIGGQTTGSSLFGGQNAAQNASLFGQKPAGSLFGGGGNQPQTGSLFGQPQQQTQQQGSSLFGGQQPQQTNSLFGGQTNTTTSAFGQPAQNASIFGGQPTTGGIFGGNQQTQQQPQSSLFGQTQAPQAGSLFGQNPQSQSSSLFGNQQQQAQGGSSLFGNTSQQGGSLFGASQPQQSGLFGNPQQAQGSLFGAQNTQGSLFGGNTANTGGSFNIQNPNQGGSLFGAPTSQPSSLFGQPQQGSNQSQGGLFGSTSAPNLQQNTPYASNFNMLTSFPLQTSILSNQSILDSNNNRNGNNMLAVVLSALVQGGAITKTDADRLLKPTPFDQLVKKREKQLQTQKKQQEQFSDIPSVFEDPINFKRFEIPEDYFEMRRSTSYWAKQKQKEEADRKKFSVVYEPKRKRQKPVLSSLREPSSDISRVVKARQVQKHQLPVTKIYTLKPSMTRISIMSINDIKRVEQVEISNTYGKIKFLQPISLLYKQIEECIQIRQDTIDIKDPEWESKKCQLTFFNFAKFSQKSQDEQNKIEIKMMKWIKKNTEDQMEFVEFDKNDGTLVVTIH